VSTFIKRFAIVLVLCLPACAQTWFSNITKNSTTTSCTIGWTTAVPTVAHVEYGLAAGSYTKSSANSTQYWRSKAQMISGLQPGTTYHFRVAAADTSQLWVRSVDYTCTTAKTTTGHSVQLNWNASSSSGVSGYRVFRSTASGGYYGLVGSAPGLTYTDQTVQSGATYYYVVAALNGAGQQSAYSNQVRAVVP
jgi:fibronectin type 3 domain-containing protein